MYSSNRLLLRFMQSVLGYSIIIFFVLICEGNIMADQYKKAVFAGGCFWCMEGPFEKIDGVKQVISGYTGGVGENPTYEDYGEKGHIEAIEITYDSKKVSFSNLLDVFWRQIDPTDSAGQFVDRGFYYSTAIFYSDESEKRIATESKAKLNESGIYDRPIVTRIVGISKFYPAEAYHQDFYKTQPIRYKSYRYRSGRDKFLNKIWNKYESKESNNAKTINFKKPSDSKLKKILTPIQYKVTQKDGTERPFDNKYWNNKEDGIYVDIVSGEVLFSSKDKFKSGTGWPSFTKPLIEENIVEKEDHSLFSQRIEVRSKNADSHLGHVFQDGPPPTGLRFCINSASLRFIHKDNLKKENLAEYLYLFN